MNRIRIVYSSNGSLAKKVYIDTELDFKPEEILVELSEDTLILSAPDISNLRDTRKFSSYQYITYPEISLWSKGHYLIDMEESNEDRLVIYREDKIST